ncbi:pantoate--beta-alanine ligase [Anaerobacillus alkaliphilus]|uniref:Pantothenate synthetase n=1 Tax=Anaerobacillus alkaliphilus TaxID=1548597 RepID=A0A4Q0VWX2_9BACI|nr:pantoate--beta-alanine ligase [Anaerobacillus alkaliphilus]RXJ03979.1 pantoate--beta-alanine ligase [Anaerobacillus alkaliphilus]
MIVVKTIAELKKIVLDVKEQGKSVGFVPTMGYLHEGHISLVNEARIHDDFIVMSIFVNPLQFGPNEDFDRYPRDFQRDEKLASEAKVDVVFYPDVNEIYPKELSCTVTVKKGVEVLCGKSRLGHFDGVATVVLKLFNIVQPTRAYFGLKDAQQVAVIENMVADFNLPVQVMKCVTLREADGLAKSSRNVYLSEAERDEAKEIFESLQQAITAIQSGEINCRTIKQHVIGHLETKTSGIVDYVEILSYPDLEEVEQIEDQMIIAVAVKFSQARLIDNVIITV